MTHVDKSISEFWIAGINYKKTDASIRGQFAVNDVQYTRMLELAATKGIKELFILSTCNRTEIYGLAGNVQALISLLCSETAGDINTFERLAYIKNGVSAIEHLFNVGAGLDSQVLGDYEIIGQVKQAAKFSKSQGFIGPFLERLVNSALQASKAVKTNTELSGGTVSVSFAAIQYIRDNITDYKNKSILLLGIGKIGRNTCKNLVDYLANKNITLINRTPEKAQELANNLGLQHAPATQLDEFVGKSEIIITATSSPEPIIFRHHIENAGSKLLIDLSVPYNVDPEVRSLPNVQLMDVDELSRLKDETLQKREAEIPKAKTLIDQYIHDFITWAEQRKHVPVLIAIKKKLQQIESCPPMVSLSDSSCNETPNAQKIQKVINNTALKLKTENKKGCNYIEAINEFFG